VKCGIGYDVHRLVSGRELVLGGVNIPYEMGLAGHSDADVLTHAVMDALLGAAGLGDIGRYFPDTDPQYKGISSLRLLERVRDIVREAGFTIHNIDSIIVAQKPKLASYLDRMGMNLAAGLNISPKQVNVKATTTEGLGFTGTGEGIAAYAITVLKEGQV